MRNPFVKRYLDAQRGASHTDGYALWRTDEEKQKRYPPKAGYSVTCCAVETGGRVGMQSPDLLSMLAKEASPLQNILRTEA